MKPDAYLINTARGGIVDEDALYDALADHRIAGAALDCFAEEPVIRPHRFGELDNVLLAPHSIAWTDELFRDIGRSVCQGMVDLSLGKVPRGVVNPQVFDRPGFQEKWARHQELSPMGPKGCEDRPPGSAGPLRASGRPRPGCSPRRGRTSPRSTSTGDPGDRRWRRSSPGRRLERGAGPRLDGEDRRAVRRPAHHRQLRGPGSRQAVARI